MPEEMAIEFNEIDSINGPIKCPEYYFEEEGMYWPDSLGYESPTIKNKPKIMPKLTSALSIKMSGKVALGKLTFFSKLALSMKSVWLLLTISANKPQVSNPAQRKML